MPPAIPLATYRIQLTADFNFDAAAAIVPYLASLGITHVYASPFMKARHGSTHGYDIVDHTQFNPELGGEAGFLRLSDRLKKYNLGLILDFVPNHMGVHFDDNPWWLDVLEWGQASPRADSFDIDWDMLAYRARGGVLLPIIGSSYRDALESGRIELRFDATEGSFSAWYFEHRLPIAPQRYPELLQTIVHYAGATNDDAGRELLSLAARYQGLRHPDRKEAPEMKSALAHLSGGADLINRGLGAYRAGPDHPAATLALHHLLERQHYKLGHWRLASSDINYRRFFDVNTLAGLRVEEAATFTAIHPLVERLIAEDRLQGLRLDHIDGLRDPAQYCRRLRRLIRRAQPRPGEPFYLLVEKILGESEALPRFSGIHGTTGYEWLNAITHVLTHEHGLRVLDETWRQVSNIAPQFEPVLKEAKRRVLETMLTSEFNVLVQLLARIAAGHYSTRDFSADSLRQALELYVLHFPVYRTYLTATFQSHNDRALIAETIAKARSEWFAADDGLFDFLRDALTLDLIAGKRPLHSKPRVRRFAFKVQQFTGPMMAKSLEDTAFYRYHRLLALNEVGGDPAAQALPVAAFHDMMRRRAAEWPHGLTATATHDTKRGEDARTRLLALAELSDEWTGLVSKWKLLNAQHLVIRDGLRCPSPAFEYMLYQTLLGAWPREGIHDSSFLPRIQAYALKAAREGKEETSWLNPSEPYEAGLRAFIERLLDPAQSAEFLESLRAFAERTALLGALTSLTQLTLKATLPGVPDFYQGTEMWDTSLVDPDNRRPVDFTVRQDMLAGSERPDWTELARRWQDGQIKLAWTRHLLQLSKQFPDVFTHGDYRPLRVVGPHGDHVIAFARTDGLNALIVAIGRSLAGFTDGGRQWPSAETYQGAVAVEGYALAEATIASSENLPLSTLFRHFPAAVLPARLIDPRRTRTRSIEGKQ